MGDPYSLTLSALTDKGRVRDNNEDAYRADLELRAFLVCDGLGGHRCGEVASGTAADAALEHLRRAVRAVESAETLDARALGGMVEEAVQAASGAVWSMARAEPRRAGMATTMLLVWVVGERAILGHVGDGRVYLARAGELHQLTRDHTMADELVQRGELDSGEARESPFANSLTRALGGQMAVLVDTLVVDLVAGDSLVLCTDGLTRYVANDSDVLRFVADGVVERTAPELVGWALEQGGEDNVTVLALGIGSEGDDPGAAFGRSLASLGQSALGRGLSLRRLSRLWCAGDVLDLPAGDKRDEHGSLLVVLEGAVRCRVEGHAVEVAAGGLHGSRNLIGSSEDSVEVEALEPSRLLSLRRRDFLALVRHSPKLGVRLLLNLSRHHFGRR